MASGILPAGHHAVNWRRHLSTVQPSHYRQPLCRCYSVFECRPRDMGRFCRGFPQSLQANAVEYLMLATAVSFHGFPQSDSDFTWHLVVWYVVWCVWESIVKQSVNNRCLRDSVFRRYWALCIQIVIPELYINTQSVPRSKHTASRLYKPVS